MTELLTRRLRHAALGGAPLLSISRLAGRREPLSTLAAERCHFGYRRLNILTRREGFAVSHKQVYRLYCEEGLSVAAAQAGAEHHHPGLQWTAPRQALE